MFNAQKVIELLKQANREEWSYPKAVSALKAASVENYTCDVATDTLIYHGKADSVQGPYCAVATPLKISPDFQVEKLKEAIATRLARDISRLEFLTLIAAAGVATYETDMNARTLTFRGSRKGEYIQPIPEG